MDLFEITKTMVITLVSAYLGFLLAFQKFKKEKFWDERRAGYKEVIEAIEEILHWAEQVRAEHCLEPSSNIPAKEHEAFRTISKYSITGKLLFTNEFYDILEDVDKQINITKFQFDEVKYDYSETEQSQFYFDLAIAIRSIVNKNLPQLIEIAKRELPK